jgi:hypothetical protein
MTSIPFQRDRLIIIGAINHLVVVIIEKGNQQEETESRKASIICATYTLNTY